MGAEPNITDDGPAVEQRLRRALAAELHMQRSKGRSTPEATLLVAFAALQSAGILVHVMQAQFGCFDMTRLEVDMIRWLSANIHDREIKDHLDA